MFHFANSKKIYCELKYAMLGCATVTATASSAPPSSSSLVSRPLASEMFRLLLLRDLRRLASSLMAHYRHLLLWSVSDSKLTI